MPQPLVHVLVVNWNGLEHLESCFESLLRQSYTNARYILIDNASRDGSADYVEKTFGQDPRVELLRCDTNLGWSRGNNAGIERALREGADYVFLLNNDTATAPDTIERMVEFAERTPCAGALAPKMVLFDQPDLLNSLGLGCSLVACAWDLGLGRLDGPRWSEAAPVIGACGGACLLRSEALRKTGPLPVDYDIYLDDLDLCLRIWDAGYEVWTCPAAVVRHKFSATMGTGALARRKYYLNTRNRMRLMLRNYPASHLPHALAAFAVSEARAIGRSLLEREWWRAAAHVRAWCSDAAFVPNAVAARRDARRRGLERGRFWPFIRTDMMFFPGIELPHRGWYEPRSTPLGTFQPISRSATLVSDGGRLSLSHVNCYPRLGPTDIELRAGGSPIARFGTQRVDSLTVDVPPGELEFVANRIFWAEETGESIDVGGWIAVTRNHVKS